MKLINFINTHENWIEILSAPPYNIKITIEGDYYILKYNQFSSDFNEELVREARGCIFYRDNKQAYRNRAPLTASRFSKSAYGTACHHNAFSVLW